jgi:hypothetical protein
VKPQQWQEMRNWNVLWSGEKFHPPPKKKIFLSALHKNYGYQTRGNLEIVIVDAFWCCGCESQK